MKNVRRLTIRPFRWAVLYALILFCYTLFVLLDAFVIPKAAVPMSAASFQGIATTGSTSASAPTIQPNASAAPGTTSANPGPATGQVLVTASSYRDANIQITIETTRQYETDIYFADIRVTSAEYLKTALAGNVYGRNFRAPTSSIAKGSNAILAINGDYYGFRNTGFVVRNGILYRSTPPSSGSSDGLLIDMNGNFSIINQKQASAQSVHGAWQLLSFGPALVNGTQTSLSEDREISQPKASNPRTAIGQISGLHYVFVVADGRTSRSSGLTLAELAQVMAARGCKVAYNLDGGGSSTLWFNGRIINSPTDGRSAGERSVSDIVYIGY